MNGDDGAADGNLYTDAVHACVECRHDGSMLWCCEQSFVNHVLDSESTAGRARHTSSSWLRLVTGWLCTLS